MGRQGQFTGIGSSRWFAFATGNWTVVRPTAVPRQLPKVQRAAAPDNGERQVSVAADIRRPNLSGSSQSQAVVTVGAKVRCIDQPL